MTRILMVSPHPTYSPRGTPISVLNRCRALSALGYEIDLITYAIGEDVPVPGLRYLRAPVPGIRSVKVGPSMAKIPLNLAVFAKTLSQLVKHPRRYEIVHSHEEAGPVGAILAKLWRIEHVYDMGNDLDVVLGNYGLGERHPLRSLVRLMENATIKGSTAIIAHFPSLRDRVTSAGGKGHCEIVFNIPLAAAPDPDEAAALRARWSPDGMRVVLYVGTFEPYQGLDLLVAATAESAEPYRVVLVGGSETQQTKIAERARDLGIEDRVLVADKIAASKVPSALECADVLVSARAVGTNTPLKIFEYLHSGTPIVATSIESHTAVLDDEVAVLAAPNPTALARGLDRAVVGGPDIAKMAQAARERAERLYSARSYLDGIADAYAAVPIDRPDIDRADAMRRLALTI